MHVFFGKLHRFSVCFLTVWVSLVLVTPFPVTASGQTTVIAAEESAGVLLARFHKKFKPKPPKPPPPPKIKIPVPPVLNLSVSNAKDVLRRARFKPLIERRKVRTKWRIKHNTVARQHPKAGDLVNTGTRVKLTLYRYKKAAASKKRRPSFPDVVVTPSPAGPIPVPFPNLPPVKKPRAGKPPAAGRKFDIRLVVRAAAARKLPQGMSARDRAALRRVVRDLKAGRGIAANAAWQGFSRSYFSKRTARNVNALIQWVLRESYLEQNKDLAFYADKVRFYNEQKKALRNHLAKLRGKARKLRGRGTVSVRPILLRPRFQKGKDAVGRQRRKTMTKTQLAAVIKDMQRKLSSVGDDGQLANIDLQNMLQKQQQILQTISNVAKMLHETAMAIIRKIG